MNGVLSLIDLDYLGPCDLCVASCCTVKIPDFSMKRLPVKMVDNEIYELYEDEMRRGAKQE